MPFRQPIRQRFPSLPANQSLARAAYKGHGTGRGTNILVEWSDPPGKTLCGRSEAWRVISERREPRQAERKRERREKRDRDRKKEEEKKSSVGSSVRSVAERPSYTEDVGV